MILSNEYAKYLGLSNWAHSEKDNKEKTIVLVSHFAFGPMYHYVSKLKENGHNCNIARC